MQILQIYKFGVLCRVHLCIYASRIVLQEYKQTNEQATSEKSRQTESKVDRQADRQTSTRSGITDERFQMEDQVNEKITQMKKIQNE